MKQSSSRVTPEQGRNATESCSFPNSYAFLNFNEWPDERMIADHATVNVARLDDLNAGAPIGVNDSTFKKLRTFGHLDGSNKLPQGFRR